jgi:ssDNA-binding Zn-finger/Zn-ribbon topoisomerase 1
MGDDFETRQCRHCNKSWRAKVTPEPEKTLPEKVVAAVTKLAGAIPYRVLRCPHCDSKDTVITSTRKPVRHHKCKNEKCKKTFRSMEE